MKIGIVGLPNVGKSTLFNAVTKAGAQVANYAFCTLEPNVGIVAVPDERLLWLEKLYNAAKCTPATIEFVDIAGLVRGASQGEGLGNKFLANIREVDAILHVVRAFIDPDITHVDGTPEPERDMDTINTELVLADLEYVLRRIDKVKKMAKGDASLNAEIAFLEELSNHLDGGKPARTFKDSSNEIYFKELFLLTVKPVLYVANVAEDSLATATQNPMVATIKTKAETEGARVVVISAQIEAELASLDAEERTLFMEELNMAQSGLEHIVSESYKLLGLISYLTAGPKEVRAWTITSGTKAPQAAGKIHSDFERGFIRAKIVAYDDLHSCQNMVVAREKGLLRSEGKDYVMQDGDVTEFLFNV